MGLGLIEAAVGAVEQRLEAGGVTDERDRNAACSGLDGPRDDLPGRAVSAHGVDGDARHGAVSPLR